MWRFILSALIIWAALHAYVFWRLGSVPLVARHLSPLRRWLLATALWASFPLAHWLTPRHLVKFKNRRQAGRDFFGVRCLCYADGAAQMRGLNNAWKTYIFFT